MASISTTGGSFDNTYLMHESIGKGAFSVVYRCTNKISKQEYAVKVLDLRPLKMSNKFDTKRLLREVDIMRSISHRNIIQLREVFESQDDIKMVMELATGRELFDLIIARSRYSEQDARPVFSQIATALAFLHGRGIVHRDVKPENIKVNSNTGEVKLLDLGLAKVTSDQGSTAKTFVGTPCYLAPEIESIRGDKVASYGVEVDCWSLGAVLYVMLVARFPEFDRSSGHPMVKFSNNLWSNVSSEAKDLIKKLMCPDPAFRLTCEQALRHPWTLGINNPPPSIPTSTENYLNSMREHTDNISTLTEVTTTTTTSRTTTSTNSATESAAAPATSTTSNNASSNLQTSGSIQSVGSAGSVESVEELAQLRSIQELSSVESAASPLPNLDSALVPSSRMTVLQAEQSQDNHSQLILLHKRVCRLFETALAVFPHAPMAARIRERAALSRTLMMDTFEVMNKLNNVATQICESLEDVNLAVDENEPVLARRVLARQKGWVLEFREGLSKIKVQNEALISSLNDLIAEVGTMIPAPQGPAMDISAVAYEKNDLSITKFNPHQQHHYQQRLDPPTSSNGTSSQPNAGSSHIESASSSYPCYQEDRIISLLSLDLSSPPSPTSKHSIVQTNADSGLESLVRLPLILKQIDKQLDNSSMLLANFDRVFEMMKSKGEMVEEYVDFTHSAKLMQRFQHRISEYMFYWKRIKETTSSNIGSTTLGQEFKMYSFVDEGSGAGGDSESLDSRNTAASNSHMNTPGGASSSNSSSAHAASSLQTPSPIRTLPRTSMNQTNRHIVGSQDNKASAFNNYLIRNGSEGIS